MHESLPESGNTKLIIRQMSLSDLPFCRHLVQEAGWNQVDTDWLRAMEIDPTGCFVAEMGGSAVGTTTGCCFDETGWIAMVLVDKKVRGQGIAEKLVSHTIQYLEGRGVRNIRLDATALGLGLYRKLGFVEEYEVTRYAGVPTLEEPHFPSLQNIVADKEQLNEVAALDQSVTGTSRHALLNNLTRSSTTPFYYKRSANGGILGYAGSRVGCNAVQIGPVVAATGEAGNKLLDRIASHFVNRPCYIDIPDQNKKAVIWAETNGFKAQRHFVRMYKGEKKEDFPEMIWASSGPEKG